MRLALYQPDIPQNLGAAVRIGACFGCPVDVIEPCGFPLTAAALKRTAMDYAQRVEIVRHPSFRAFLAAPERAAGRLVLIETDGAAALHAFAFAAGDTLLFGRESVGSAPETRAAATATVRIPMAAGSRSLNVAVACGVAVAEALRQTGGFSRFE